MEKAMQDRISQTAPRATSEADSTGAKRQEGLISETLEWCCELFGTSRARMIRPLEAGRWVVYTRQREALMTHAADYAEIAMAYTVGLSRQPLAVTKPRVSHADGTNLRPIALTGYLGIPVVCQDRLVGVVELSGEIRPDMDMALHNAVPRLQSIAERLTFDPALARPVAISRDSIIELSSSIWTSGEIVLTEDDMVLLATIDGPMALADAARTAELPDERAAEIAASLASRGLIAVQPL